MSSELALRPLLRRFARSVAGWARSAWGAMLVVAASFCGVAVHADEPTLLAQAAWIESGQSVTIEQASTRFADQFKPTVAHTVYPLGPDKTLWIRLRLQVNPGATSDWGLDLPVPLLDAVTVYQQDPQGKWSAQRAGDRLPVASWNRPGRYASFDLILPPGVPRDVFVQVRHGDPIGFALRIAPAAELEQARKLEYLALGMILGTLMLLTVWCLIQSGIYRDIVYAWYSLFAATMTLTMSAVTGVAAHLLWSHSPVWADQAQGVLPIALAGVNILFQRHLCSIGARYPKVDGLALATGALVMLMSGAYLLQGRFPGPDWLSSALVAFSLIASLMFTFILAGLAWRRNDVVGGWVFLAYLPLALTIVVAILRLYGVISARWLTFDGSALACAMAVPLLLVALHARSGVRHGLRTRVNKLTEQDALTGLLSDKAFLRQLSTTVKGARLRRDAAAVVMVELVNLQQIRQSYGDAMAEQCLLWSVIKLYRVVREGDPAGRVGTASFAIIFDGVKTRAELQERMVRLVTAGLTTSRGVNLDIPLQFNVACMMLSEHETTPTRALRQLHRLLARMSPKTRRPIRFVEPREGSPASRQEGPESELGPPSTGLGPLQGSGSGSTGAAAL
jgi:diguanylate cyclase (GGDEF)-like protein